MAKDLQPTPTTTPAVRRLPPLVAGGLGLGILGLMALGIGGFHFRAALAAAADARTAEPLPVETIQVTRAPGYDVVDRFAGRLEPARETSLAFEQSGLVIAVAVDEGARIAKDEVIARLDTDLLEARRGELNGQKAEVTANLRLAELTFGRQQTLRADGHISEQRLDEARLGVSALRGTLAQIDASLSATAIDIAKSEIRAPFAGTIAERFVDEGAVVSAGAPIVRLLESGIVRARIGVSPEAAAILAVGAPVRIRALGADAPGTIETLRSDLSASTRTVTTLVRLDGPIAVPFGDTVELAVPRTVSTPGFWVPIAALIEGRRGLWTVFVAEPDGDGHRIRRESVELIQVSEDRAFVQGTLTDGQRVVASGPHRVIPGQPVAVLDRAR